MEQLDEQPNANCSFTLFAQLNSVNVPETLMEEYELEVQTPTGIHITVPPRLSLKGVLLSTECGMLYELDNMEGLRSKVFFRKVITCKQWLQIYLCHLSLKRSQTQEQLL